jgi:hypothetical protein
MTERHGKSKHALDSGKSKLIARFWIFARIPHRGQKLDMRLIRDRPLGKRISRQRKLEVAPGRSAKTRLHFC